MDNLYPEGYETEIINDDDLENDSPIGYRPGVAFDMQTGDFIRDGRNDLLEATGVESWESWCQNCLLTERGVHLAYSDEFGIDYNQIFSASNREEAENILTRQVTESIMADPYERTAYVRNIEFEWTAPDSVLVSVTIVGIDDVTIDITAYLTGGES